jgi:hypothetical protein
MNVNTDSGTYSLNTLPNQCPFCHKSIIPVAALGHTIGGRILEVFMHCANATCQKSFIAYYKTEIGTRSAYYNGETTIGSPINKIFSEKIKEISSDFTEIYSQASSAEQQNLLEICGVGYRKALEFLIKDYCIKIHPEERNAIETKFLKTVIEEYVEDTRIKSVSKRAVWLGNDETHYVRKWDGKNLEDLKKLIDLTIHWIEMEALTLSFETEMPDKG